MYLPFTLIYDNTSPSQEAQNATVGRTEVENSLSDNDRSKHMRIFDKKCCFKHTYKIEHHCFRRGLEKPRREEENMLVPAFGQEETLLSASSEFGVSQYSVFCPTRRLRNRCCQFVVAACDIATRLGMSS
jgi:hypothetical protein